MLNSKDIGYSDFECAGYFCNIIESVSTDADWKDFEATFERYMFQDNFSVDNGIIQLDREGDISFSNSKQNIDELNDSIHAVFDFAVEKSGYLVLIVNRSQQNRVFTIYSMMIVYFLHSIIQQH